MRTKRLLPLAAAIAVTGIALAGCSTTPDTTTAGSTTTAAANLPAVFQGTLTDPVIIYPPYGEKATSGGTEGYTGLDVDMTQAIAGQLGLTIHEKEDAWENQLAGLTTGKYVWVHGAEVTAEREKTYDMVAYMNLFNRFAVKSGAADFSTTDQMCGMTIGAVSGSVLATAVPAQSTVCTTAGKKAITTKTFKDLASGALAVQSGQIDAMAGEDVALQDLVKANTALKISGPEFQKDHAGMALKKGTGAAEVTAKAIDALIADGSYAKIMKKYGMADYMVDSATVNPTP